MRNIPQQAIDLVQRFEGCKLTRYIDATGNPTIGIGHLIKPGENLFEITEDDALSLLHTDLRIAASAVLRLTDASLDDNQFSALIDFVYNLGAGIYQSSTLRTVINRGDLSEVAFQFKRWVFGGAVKLPGLIVRRQAEADLFLS